MATVRRTETALTTAVREVAGWPRRRVIVAALVAGAMVVIVAIPTAMIANPIFGREIPPTAWAWPALVVSALLSGLLFATYVRRDDVEPRRSTEQRAGAFGGFLTYLAVGCPVCNKLALVALGSAGAVQWFAPIQPWLAAGAIVLLAWALVRRLTSDVACSIPGAGPTAREAAGAEPVAHESS